MGEYENEMIERGGREAKLSKVNTEMVHQWDTLMESPMIKMGMKKDG